MFFVKLFASLTATVTRKTQFLRNRIVGKANANASVRTTQTTVIFITTILTYF